MWIRQKDGRKGKKRNIERCTSRKKYRFRWRDEANVSRGRRNNGKQAVETDKGISTPKTQNEKMVSSSIGKREVPAEQNGQVGTPKSNQSFDTGFEGEINV